QSVRYGRLSGGQKQRVQCAVALCGGPKLLVLDEPTASLDVAARQDFHKMISAERRKGTTILITSHDMAEVGQMASRIIVFANGRILADGTQDQLVERIEARDLLINTVLSSEYIMTLPSVVSVKRQGAQMIVRSRDLESTIAALRANDPNLSGPIVQTTDLQTAYLELVEGFHQ
ncbi:MAG: ATP-binding cassette domain-containing protein, partial [Rhodocyclaceae bacterium]|nr:ATP-binding cassette domain-containing protein [Rhodocyclaceae bacterium]